MSRLFVFSAVVVVLAGVLPARASDSSPATGSREFIEAGRKLYTAKCARCHKFYNPANYPDAKWREWMDKMSRKAKLKPDQKEILSEYLETFRKGTGTNAQAGER